MRNTVLTRSLAVIGAGALLVSTPVAASAQSSDPVGSVQGAVSDSAGGALASVGLGDLGSDAAGGRCVAVDPGTGSTGVNFAVDMSSNERSPGVAHVDIQGGSLVSRTEGTLHWTNTTTNTSGEAPFEVLGGLDSRFTAFDVETGAGHVTWDIEANQVGMPFSIMVALVPVAQFLPIDPSSAAPYSSCSGEADIA